MEIVELLRDEVLASYADAASALPREMGKENWQVVMNNQILIDIEAGRVRMFHNKAGVVIPVTRAARLPQRRGASPYHRAAAGRRGHGLDALAALWHTALETTMAPGT